MKHNLKCLVWRSGGTENFKWHRTIAMSPDEAARKYQEVVRMGRKVYLVDYKQSLAAGLPDTYE